MAIELTNIIKINNFNNGVKDFQFVHKNDFDPTDYTLMETITSASEPVQVWIPTAVLERWNAE